MSECIIDFENITSVMVTSKEITFKNNTCKLSVLGGLESHNVIITLRNTNTLYKLYGIKKPFTMLALSIDDKHVFSNLINQILNNKQPPTIK